MHGRALTLANTCKRRRWDAEGVIAIKCRRNVFPNYLNISDLHHLRGEGKRYV
jgi:hypothetical protein